MTHRVTRCNTCFPDPKDGTLDGGECVLVKLKAWTPRAVLERDYGMRFGGWPNIRNALERHVAHGEASVWKPARRFSELHYIAGIQPKPI